MSELLLWALEIYRNLFVFNTSRSFKRMKFQLTFCLVKDTACLTVMTWDA